MKKDLEEFLLSLEKQHQEMKKAAEEAVELLKANKISKEQADQITSYMSSIDANYNRVLYCRYLYNLPPKFIQKIQNKKISKKLEKFKNENADEDTVLSENQDNLDKVADIIKEDEVNE